MNISKMYDITWKLKCKSLSSLCYKMNKFIVNKLYPKTVKLQWGLDEKSDVIVSLTSFPARIETVWITIATILNQTIKPGKIILWLADEQFPDREKNLPRKLLELKRYGLTIRFCDNLYPHKKYYYTMLENPDATVITVDDDVFYPEYLIEELLKTSEKYPHTVCCTWAHRITTDKNNRALPYEKWKHCVTDGNTPESLLMPVGIGGVLYPPHALYEQAFDKEKLSEAALMTDDLWLKAMEILGNVKAVRIEKKYRKTYFTIINTQESSLNKENVGEQKNTRSIQLIENMYPQVMEKLVGG